MPYVKDAVHGEVHLEPLEYELLQTVEMQALNRRRLLGFAYLGNLTPTHSRLSHAIGRLHILTRILRESHLNERLDANGVRRLRLAALIRDVGKTCFAPYPESGMREPDALKIPRPDEIVKRVLEGGSAELWRTFARWTDEGEEGARFVCDVVKDPDDRAALVQLVQHTGTNESQLIVGPLDVDRLDHIRRDAFFYGYHNASFDDALFAGYTLIGGRKDDDRRLVMRNNPIVLGAIEDVIYSRWYLYRHGYLHPAVIAANRMLLNILRELPPESAEALVVLGDDQLLGALADRDNPLQLKEGGQGAALARRLLERRLYRPVFAWTPELDGGEGPSLFANDNARRIALRAVEKKENIPPFIEWTVQGVEFDYAPPKDRPAEEPAKKGGRHPVLVKKRVGNDEKGAPKASDFVGLREAFDHVRLKLDLDTYALRYRALNLQWIFADCLSTRAPAIHRRLAAKNGNNAGGFDPVVDRFDEVRDEIARQDIEHLLHSVKITAPLRRILRALSERPEIPRSEINQIAGGVTKYASRALRPLREAEEKLSTRLIWLYRASDDANDEVYTIPDSSRRSIVKALLDESE